MSSGPGATPRAGTAPAPSSRPPGRASPPGPDWNSLNLPSREPRRKRTIVLVVGVVVVIVVATSVGVLASGVLRSKAPCNPTIPSPWNSGSWAVLTKCGSEIIVPAHHFYGYDAERFSDAQVLLGTFTSTSAIGVYLLNQTLFTALTGRTNLTTPPTNYSWSAGEVTGDTLDAIVPPSPSEYFLTLENLGDSNATISWSQSLVVAYITVQNS